MIAFLADIQRVANLWLRPGNTRSANNASAFLSATIEHLGGKRIGLLRADSEFSEAELLEEIEAKHRLNYIIALRLHQPLQRALVRAAGWWSVTPGIECASFDYPASSWRSPWRVVAIRQHIEERENAPGKTLSLFANDPQFGKYRDAALVTNLSLPVLELWRTYRGRADAENRIKELKYDFTADSFCLDDFFATEVCLNVVMMAFNLMSLFRQTLLKSTSPRTLKTLRYQLFGVAGYLIQEGRKPILKLALAMKRRVWSRGCGRNRRASRCPPSSPPFLRLLQRANGQSGINGRDDDQCLDHGEQQQRLGYIMSENANHDWLPCLALS